MDQLLNWGWQGALILAVPYLLFKMVPVALDAWKGNNPAISIMKTVGPLFSLAVLLFGGWMVIGKAVTYIYEDAQSNPLIVDAQEWTSSGASALSDGVDDLGDSLTTLSDKLGDGAAAGTGAAESAPAEGANGSGNGNTDAGDNTWRDQGAAPTAAPTAAPRAQGSAAPAPTATRTVGVHAAQPDYAGAISPDEIDNMAAINARQGEQARAEATRTGDSGSLNGNSENLMFGIGGGGPPTDKADAVVAAVEQRTYRVQRGEGLSDVAVKFYGAADKWDNAMRICTANKLRDCNRLGVNQLLIIP